MPRGCTVRPPRADGAPAWVCSDCEMIGYLRLPLILFRITVGGYGLYLIARRLLRVEYGYSTLALALWGTVLTLFGYAAIWLGIRLLYQGSRSARRVAISLGLILGVYGACEVAYSVWYAGHYWPVYHRYL